MAVAAFSVRLNAAQAQTLADLTAAMGAGSLAGYGPLNADSPLYYKPADDDHGYLILTNGDLLDEPA